eukprot:SAG22_NODE_53_length_24242_cov_158.884231_14_plen_126_part_00
MYLDYTMNNTKMSWLAKTYVLIKSIDPFHATVGAVNCANSWSFADGAASYLTPTVSLSDRVIPVGNCTDLASSDCKQPVRHPLALQPLFTRSCLSLAVYMYTATTTCCVYHTSAALSPALHIPDW